MVQDLVSDTYGYVGKRFGQLTVLQAVGKTKSYTKIYRVLCDCGNTKDIVVTNLKQGKSKSCGCSTYSYERRKRHGHTWVGGFSKTYSAWDNMHGRCHRRKKDPTTKYWRGIEICERWNLFDNFLEDMGEKPEGLTLDRIDSTKGYFPENCRWASRTVQSRNTAMKSNNTSGFTGVRKHTSGGWNAYISVANKQINLGTYKTKQEAATARKAGEEKYWGDER